MLRRQHLIYLTFMNYTILNLQLLPAGFSVARKDLWISFLLSSTVGVIICWLISQIEKKYPDQTLFQLLIKQAHPVVRLTMLLVLILYTFALCALTTTQFAEFINIGFLQETPFWVISALFVTSIVHALRKGLMSIANVAGLLTFSTAISGSIMSIANAENQQFVHFLPIGEYGIRPILLGVLYCLPIWVELFFIPLLPRKGIGSKGWMSTYLWVVAVNTFIIVGHDLSPVSTFGLEQTLNLNFPLLSSVKIIHLGLIDRFDVYGLALMIFGSYVRVSLYLVVTLMQIQSMFPYIKNTRSWPIIVSAGSLVFTASIFLYRNSPTFTMISQQWFVYTALFVLSVFVCLYIYLGVAFKTSKTVAI